MIPKARQKELVVQEIADEIVVYDLNTSKAYCLNETLAPIWQLCDGENSVADIAAKLSRQLNTGIGEDFVLVGLDQLRTNGLLEDIAGIEFEPFSRREIIRKVGFSTIVTMPILTSVVAPRAVNAQSPGGIGEPFYDCTADGVCNPGLLCVPTVNCPSLNPSCTPSGMAQCCSGSSRLPGSTFCTLNPCGPQGPSQCCTGIVSTGAPIPGCDAPGQITCVCG